MTRELWAADVTITPELARAAIRDQFAHVPCDTVERFGEGWDNAAFLVDGKYVFRFPRRRIAVGLIETEIAVLPQIAPRLPLRISAPLFAGRPSDAFAWPFAGYATIAGTPLTSKPLAERNYRKLAAGLGRFFGALHAIDAAPLRRDGLPLDEIGRLDHAQRRPMARDRLEQLSTAGIITDASSYLALLDAIAPSGPRADRLTLVHGDAYARHVLVDDNGYATGIIDWGDVHYGDPAIDVSVMFEILPPFAREAFAAAYGTIDAETERLARYRAVHHAAMVAHYGYRIADESLREAGLAGLDYAMH